MPNLNMGFLSQTKRNAGFATENLALDYLQKQGFVLLQRNFNCRLGEIDLIGMHQNQLVFVEVRFRKNNDHGTAAETVTYYKQRKIIRTARFFLCTRPKWAKTSCRFDVVAITLKQGQPHIDWIPNAFY